MYLVSCMYLTALWVLSTHTHLGSSCWNAPSGPPSAGTACLLRQSCSCRPCFSRWKSPSAAAPRRPRCLGGCPSGSSATTAPLCSLDLGQRKILGAKENALKTMYALKTICIQYIENYVYYIAHQPIPPPTSTTGWTKNDQG